MILQSTKSIGLFPQRPEPPASYESCFSMPLSPAVSWILYVVNPKWSYRLNSDFEDHAMREYAKFVEEHPEFDEVLGGSEYQSDDGFHVTVGDMLRQVAVDEEQHKNHSEEYITKGARFARDAQRAEP